MPLVAFVPGGPPPRLCLPVTTASGASADLTDQTQSTDVSTSLLGHGSCSTGPSALEIDAVSFMAMGKRSRLPENPTGSISDMPSVARQEEEEDDEGGSDSDTSSVSDPNWQNTELFTVIQSSVIRQLNIPHANLRRMQIASALSWATASIAGEYPLAYRPVDMVENQIRARLIRHIRDLPQHHTQQLVLVDVEFHPPAPRFDFERIRMPIYALQFMSAIGFVRAMYLLPYCRYAELPCFLWRNGVYWSLEDESLHRIQNGDYLRVVVPPPNPGYHECHPRSMAAALHMGLNPDTLPLTENLMGDEELSAMPNPYRILLQADAFPDPMEDVQQLLQTSVRYSRPTRILPDQTQPAQNTPRPRIQATLGYHNACELNQLLDPMEEVSQLLCTPRSSPHLAEFQPERSQDWKDFSCPRIQATLGYHNACEWNRIGAHERQIDQHFALAEPPVPHAMSLPSDKALPCPCPRMQATLGYHHACLGHAWYWICRISLALCTCGWISVQKHVRYFVPLAVVARSLWAWIARLMTRYRNPAAQATRPQALRSRRCSSRHAILASQRTWVATDEMKFYLRQCSLRHGVAWTAPCIVDPTFPPVEQAVAVDQWSDRLARHHANHAAVISAILIENHWIPIIYCPDTQCVLTVPAGSRILRSAARVHDWSFVPLPATPCQAPDMCGFEAVYNIAQQLTEATAQATDFSKFLEAANKMRRQFRSHLTRTGTYQRRFAPCHMEFGGAGTGDLHAEVVTILSSKGVPADAVEERAKIVLSKLGRQPLSKALRGQNPWKEIKQLANFASPKVQLVLPSELEQVVQARIATGAPFGDRRKKAPKSSSKPPVQLQAEDIAIPDGFFGMPTLLEFPSSPSKPLDLKPKELLLSMQTRPLHTSGLPSPSQNMPLHSLLWTTKALLLLALGKRSDSRHAVNVHPSQSF